MKTPRQVDPLLVIHTLADDLKPVEALSSPAPVQISAGRFHGFRSETR